MASSLINSRSCARCVLRTQSADEAHRVAHQFELQGYNTEIRESKQANLVLFDVWITRKNSGFKITKDF